MSEISQIQQLLREDGKPNGEQDVEVLLRCRQMTAKEWLAWDSDQKRYAKVLAEKTARGEQLAWEDLTAAQREQYSSGF